MNPHAHAEAAVSRAHTRRDVIRERMRERRDRAAEIETLLSQEEDNGGKLIVRFRFFTLLLFVIAVTFIPILLAFYLTRDTHEVAGSGK